MRNVLSTWAASPYATLVKWASMAAAVFWTLVYQISQQELSLPEFVYVNF